jgi:hypothetical protein
MKHALAVLFGTLIALTVWIQAPAQVPAAMERK